MLALSAAKAAPNVTPLPGSPPVNLPAIAPSRAAQHYICAPARTQASGGSAGPRPREKRLPMIGASALVRVCPCFRLPRALAAKGVSMPHCLVGSFLPILYSTMNRNRCNLLKTNDRCTLYSTISRGGLHGPVSPRFRLPRALSAKGVSWPPCLASGRHKVPSTPALSPRKHLPCLNPIDTKFRGSAPHAALPRADASDTITVLHLARK